MRLGSSTTPQRARLNWWPGSIFTHQSKRSSRQCSLLGKWWLLFSLLFVDFLLVDLTPLSSTINAAAYQETLKRLKEAIWQKRPGCWPMEFLLCNTVLNLTVLLQPWIFWTHEGGRFFHIHQAVLIFSVGLRSVPRDEKILLTSVCFHSAEYVQNEVKNCLRA